MLTALYLLACTSDPGSSSTDAGPTVATTPPVSTPTPPDQTTPTVPSTDTGDGSRYVPAGAVELTGDVVASADGCDTATDGALIATGAPGTISLDRSGPTEGCGCDVRRLQAWMLPDEGRITLRWVTGSCDGVFCCESTGTVLDVPPGTWTVDEYWGDLTTTVTVP